MTVATEKKVQIQDLHFELSLWINELKFFKNEIKIFNHRLEEVVQADSHQEVLQQLEHFQNQYIRQDEVNDELRHEIKQHENLLERSAEDNKDSLDPALYQEHSELREQVDQFKKIYYELKDEFMKFLREWMI